jgi:fucose permease
MAQSVSQPVRINRARLIPAAIAAILVYGMIATVLGTLLPTLLVGDPLSALTTEQKGTLTAISAIGLVISSLAIGPLIDLRGKKTSLVGGIFLITLALFSIPNSRTFGLLALMFFVLNLGGGMVVTGSNALASDVGEEKRGTTLNLLNLFFGLGGFITPFIAGSIFFRSNPVGLCYLVGSICGLTLLLEIFTPMPPPSGRVAFKISDAARLITRPALILLSALLFLYVAAEVGIWNWLTSYLVSQDVPKDTATNILAFGFALGLLFGRLIVSGILVKVPAIQVTLFSALAMAVTTYGVLQVHGAVAAGILVFCAGLAMAPVFPTTLAMVGDAFPVGTASAMGIAITSGWLGLVFSSKIIGVIADQVATPGIPDSGLKTALLVLPAASVLMVVVNLALRPMLKKHMA